MLALLGQWGPWLWLGLCVLLVSLEVVLPGLHFIWFGIAAGFVALAAFAGFNGLEWQLALFGLLSLTALYLGRGLSGRTPKSDADAVGLNDRGQQYVGRRVVVDEPIINGRGKVRVGDTVWLAEGKDAPAGTEVTISATRGTILIVNR
jgi:inner membrane protein